MLEMSGILLLAMLVFTLLFATLELSAAVRIKMEERTKRASAMTRSDLYQLGQQPRCSGAGASTERVGGIFTLDINSSQPSLLLDIGTAADSLYSEDEFGSKFCALENIPEFKRRFVIEEPVGNGSAGPFAEYQTDSTIRFRDTCKEGASSVLWIYPQGEFEAFAIREYECYRLMFWADQSCSVTIVRVSSVTAAVRVLGEYAPRSLRHVVVGGHGSGSMLQWGRDQYEYLQIDHHMSEVFFLMLGQTMQPEGTVFLDSCYSATKTLLENLALYATKVMAVGGAPPGLKVYGSVYSFSREDVKLVQDPTGDKHVSQYGAQEYIVRPVSNPVVPLGEGDWVRMYLANANGQRSAYTKVGFVQRVIHIQVVDAGGFRFQVPRLRVQFEDVIQEGLDTSWVREWVKPGQSVDAQVGQEVFTAVFHGQAQGATPLSATIRFTEGPLDQQVRVVHAISIKPQPKTVYQSGVIGDRVTKVGDWVRVGSTYQTEAGVAVEETHQGVRVFLGNRGKRSRGERLLDIDSKSVVMVMKPGASVVTYYYQNGKRQSQLGFGIFLEGTTTGLAKVRFGAVTTLVKPDWILSARADDGEYIFRSSVSHCPCKRLGQSDWTKYAKGCAAGFCCNLRAGPMLALNAFGESASCVLDNKEDKMDYESKPGMWDKFGHLYHFGEWPPADLWENETIAAEQVPLDNDLMEGFYKATCVSGSPETCLPHEGNNNPPADREEVVAALYNSMVESA